MSEATVISVGHPLFRELRNGMLWHCTSPKEFLQIQTDGFIKPNDGQVGKYGTRRSACQELQAISLFDFTTQSAERVLGAADKWQQFLGCARPLTIVVGFARPGLPGRLVAYPENRGITPCECSGPIPWVEVCHCGSIPVSAIASHLLVCAVDCSQFRILKALDKATLDRAETEYAKVAQAEDEERAKLIKNINQSPDLKAQWDKARRLAEELRRQK
jgi:hypothetical protein